jgi:hypothetical protein
VSLKAQRKEQPELNRQDHFFALFLHDEFPNEELFCSVNGVRIHGEVPNRSIFDEIDRIVLDEIE